MAMMMFWKDGPSTAVIAEARISSGTAKNMSTSRIKISSHLPPRNPARLPIATPATTVTDTTMNASRSEVRAPQTTP